MNKTYFPIPMKQGGIFLGIVVGTGIVITTLFGFMFGFDTWQQNMQTAAALMTAASVTPVAPSMQIPVPNSAGQFLCPIHGSVGLPVFDAIGNPHCPLCGQLMNFNCLNTNNLTLAVAGGG